MPSRWHTRLRRLEARKMATDQAHARRIVVVREDDPLPDDLGPSDQVIRVVYLPRKAASVEAWERQCRERQGNGARGRAPGDMT
jgi:hypothetical protein